MGSARTRAILSAVLVVLALFVVYGPSLTGSYLWDDDTHYTKNAVLQPGGLADAWLGRNQPNYWPITWSAFWLEHQLVGFDSTVSHVTNVLLHAANALLLWALLRRLRCPLPWGVALLFALHPVNVESVAWVTQRKNLLAMLFGLAATFAFVSRMHGPVSWRDGWGVGFFAASVLAKGAAVGLPVVLFLLLWWKRLPVDRAAWVRLAPYAAITALFCAIELLFMSPLTSHPIFELQPGERVLLMIRNLAFYVEKSLLPLRLGFIYPRWELGWPSLAASWVLVPWLGLTTWGLVRRAAGWRGLIAAQVAFVAMIAPVLGLFDVFFFKFSYVADHYLYLALPAALVVVAAGLERLPRAPSLLLLGLLCVAFAVQSWTQAGNYRNAEVLWTRALERNPDAWMAHNHLAVIYQLDRRLEEARHHYEAALEAGAFLPDAARIQYNLAVLHASLGQYPQARDRYREALRGDPTVTQAWINLAEIHGRLGNLEERDATLRRGLSFAADPARIHYQIALALQARGETDAARKHLERARSRRLGPGSRAPE